MNALTHVTTKKFDEGFSMIEVLVSLFVLSIGLLGIAFLQAQGMRLTTDSYLRTQATILAYNIIDSIRANKTGSDSGAYCLSTGAPADPCNTTAAPAANNCGDGSGCTSKEAVAGYDITRWYTLQNAYLPVSATPSSIQRQTVVTALGNTVFQYTITMRWMEREMEIAQQWVVEI